MAAHRHFNLNTFKVIGKELPGNVKVLLAGTFFYMIAWGIIEPFIPLYLESIVGNYTMVGLVYAVVSLVIFAMAIPTGDLIDKIKSTKLMKISLIIYPIVGLAYAFAANIWHLLVARILHGVGNPLLWVSTESFIRQNTTKENSLKGFGWFATIKNLGFILGCVLAAFLIVLFSYNQLYLILIPLSLVSLAIIWRIKDADGIEREGLLQGIEDVVGKDKIFKKELGDFFRLGKTAVILAVLVVFGSMMLHIIYFVIPLVSEDIEISLSGLALLYGALQIPFLFCFLLAGFAGKEGKIKVIQIGLLSIAIILALLYLTIGSLLAFVVLTFAMAFVMALLIPTINGIISDITPSVEIGEITGVYYASFFLGGTIGPMIFGVIGDIWSLETVFIVSAALSFVLLAVVFALRKQLVE
ncbi:MAG: MFS transporter [Candidatus Diapherotrites archaeon]|nr:MFS transporter [Candidatus Diapherotrites archaeon]